MKWYWPLLIFATAAAIYAAGVIGQRPSVAVGEPRAWSLVTLDGETIDQVNPTGGVTVMEFWATWCPPCVEAAPHVSALYEKYRDTGMRLVSVSLDEDPRDQRRFIAEHRLSGLHANDYLQAESLAMAWGVRGVPHTIIFSPTGETLWQGHPAQLDRALPLAVALYAESGAAAR